MANDSYPPQAGGGIYLGRARPSGGPSIPYSTTFGADEAPLSESGLWVVGGAVGLDWLNVNTSGGNAVASGISGGYNDSIAHINAGILAFPADQYVEGVVYRAAGYNPASQHEIELLLRWQITAHSAIGYECLFGHAGNNSVVRWNGALGSYTSAGAGTATPAPADGDIYRAEIVGNIITVKRNGVTMRTLNVTTAFGGGTVYSSGQPGIGFWPTTGGAVPGSYGWKSIIAGAL